MRLKPFNRVAMLIAGLVLAFVTPALQASSPPLPPAATVRTANGEVAGRSLEGGGAVYTDIPFAAPPVGDLRWAPPSPPRSWDGVRPAIDGPGASCPQPDQTWNREDSLRGAEDCLKLNVWTLGANSQVGPAAPVMVWFHGGAFIGGSGNAPFYDGGELMRRGVVVVTVNYRLGVLGFLAHPELSATSPDHTSGNYGIQDQIAALEWIRDNIANFGGDPDNVTIFGQSAGSISVSTLVTIPRARKLFGKAIMQSGSAFGFGELRPLRETEKANADFGSIDELRGVPADELVARWDAYAAAGPAFQRRTWPIVDGQLVARQPGSAYLTGVAADLPMIVGSNAREFPGPPIDQMKKVATLMVGDAAAGDLVAAYADAKSDPIVGDVATQMLTDLQFRCGSIMMARQTNTAWLYHFMQPMPGQDATGHSHELPYVFSPPPGTALSLRPFDVAEQALSSRMLDYWANFAKRGDPNGEGLPPWERHSATTDAYAELSAESVTMKTDLRARTCAPLMKHWGG